MQASIPLKLYRGDTRTFRFVLENIDDQTEAATPVDLTQVTMKAQFRSKPDSPDVWAELPITKTNPTKGEFHITIDRTLAESLADPYDTNQILSGFYDIQLQSLDGKEIWTPVKGTVSLERDVTRAD